MKNRVLSVLLSIGIILSNFSTGFVAIAEEIPAVTTTTGEGDESGVGGDDVIDPSESIQPGNNNIDEPEIEPGNDPNAENPGDKKIAINVSLKENKNLTIYNGQEDCINKIYNDPNNDGKPRYSEFFSFESSDWSDEMYQNIDAKFERVTEDVEEGKVVYSLSFVLKNDNLKDTYTIEYEEDFRFALRYDYHPNDIIVNKIPGDGNKVYLQCETNGFLIGNSNDESSFVENQIVYSSLVDNKYFIRNNDQGSVEFNAISTEYFFTGDTKMMLYNDAIVSDIDLSKIKAYNKSVTVTITAQALSDKISFSLWNDGIECFAEREVLPSGKDDQTNMYVFSTQYTFNVKSNNIVHIRNLKAKISADNSSQEVTLTLKDENGNVCQTNDFIIETKKPTEFHPVWGNDRDENGQKVIPFYVTEYETEITKIEYHFDNDAWTEINDVQRNGSTYNFEFRTDCDNLEDKILYLCAIDAAGNQRYCIRYKGLEGKWMTGDDADNYSGSNSDITDLIDADVTKLIDAVDSVELWYSNESEPTADEDWVELTGASSNLFHTYSFGNAINKEWLQIRVKSESESKFFINGSELSAHKTSIDIDDDGEADKTIVDYYYYNIKSGNDCSVMFSVKNKNNMLALEVFADKFDQSIKIKNKYIIVESVNPTSQLDNPKFASENVAVTNKWYGIKELKEETGTFNIHIDDQNDGSGIRAIKINDNGSVISATAEHPIIFSPENGEVYNITSTLTTQNFYSGAEKISKVDVSIPLELFTDGDHVLEITVVDNAGNTQTGFTLIENDDSTPKINTLEFSTDFTAPKGTITLVSESTIIPDKNGIAKDWFDASDKVSFNFTIDDEDSNKKSNPYMVVWTANNNAQTVKKYFESQEKTTVTCSLEDTTADLDNNHSYTISAVFYDQAGNASEDGTVEILTFYKDINNPEIDSVSVSRAPESGIGKVLRILTFGIFANDNVTITVKAHDVDNDSGLNSNAVKISLDEGENYNTISNGKEYEPGKWEYKYSIPVSDIPQSGDIAVKVTDQFGHDTEKFDKIYADGEVAEGSNNSTDSKYYMFETKKPSVLIDPPKSDGVARTDSQVWYNSDKDIVITVSDADSGIHNISVYVNDEQITRDSNNINFIWESAVKDNDIHEYHLSTEDLREILRNSGKLPADGHYVIKVEAEDNAGNKNDVDADAKDYYLDYDAPEVQKIDFSLPSADGDVDTSKFITELEYGFYFKTDLVATVNVNDNIPSSGLHRIEYVLIDYNNGVKGEEHPGTAYINEDGKASFNIHANFKGQILVKAFDYVENESLEKAPELFIVDTPERHESEQHIEITGMGGTDYTDAEGHPLFSSNVNLTVRVIDTMSGIREISYSLDSENDIQENKTIVLSNTGYSINQDLGDGWTITAMDENLVTEVVRNYTFSADNNDIQLSIGMKDRANNESSKESDVFSVDQTAPVINVAFDAPAGNGDCYRAERTATITIIERNFDSSRITPSIQNTFGGTPTIGGFSDVSKTEHTATITFGEGDYTFSIAGTDRCDHTATINYSGGNEQSFRVDMTDPVLVHNFDQFINDAKNSYNIDKEMTLTITEHNFIPSMVAIHIYRTAAGQELSTSNREECTSEYISANKWESTGDTHTISFTFSSDYVYQVVIGGTDESGRAISDTTSPVFEIDKTKPVLKTPKNLDILVYTIKNTETEATPIIFEDSNIAKVEYSVVSYQMKINEDNVGYDMSVNSTKFESKNGTVKIGNEFFNQDGIYEVKCVPYDIAGNAGDESTHTYVIQRETDFLVYIPNSNKENHTGLYKFDQTGIRSADFEDIEIISYITKDKTFTVEVDGVEVTDSDLETKHDDRKINQVDMYDVTVKNSYISQNFSEDTVDTDLTLNAIAKSDNVPQVITLGHIYIDNVKPMGEYEKSLQDIGLFDGYYGVESKTVMIEGVSPDIDVNRCEIQTNNETLTFENGGFQYDENAHTISFTLNKGYTDIRPTLVDNAGNINNLELIKNVYVGNLFARWWYLFILGGLVILSIPTVALHAKYKKVARKIQKNEKKIYRQ